MTTVGENKNSEAKWLEEQKSFLASIVVGNKDINGNDITRVYVRADQYVIYEIGGARPIDSLRVQIYEKVEGDTVPQDNYSKIKDSFDRIKSVIHRTGVDTSYRQRVASAIGLAIEGHITESKTLFENIEADANEDFRHAIYGRLSYLFGALLLLSITGMISISTYINRGADFFASNPQVASIIYSLAFAMMGGFLSVSLRAKNILSQRAISIWMYAIFGAERLIISAISGIAAYALVSSGLLLGSLIDGVNGLYGILSICFLSGFSETLVPNSLAKIEGGADQSR